MSRQPASRKPAERVIGRRCPSQRIKPPAWESIAYHARPEGGAEIEGMPVREMGGVCGVSVWFVHVLPEFSPATHASTSVCSCPQENTIVVTNNAYEFEETNREEC